MCEESWAHSSSDKVDFLHVTTVYEALELQLYSFLTSSLDGGHWLDSRAGRFNPKERAPGTHWVRSWVASEAIWSLWRRNNNLGFAGSWTTIPHLIIILTELSRLRQESETIKHSRIISLCSRTLRRSTRWLSPVCTSLIEQRVLMDVSQCVPSRFT